MNEPTVLDYVKSIFRSWNSFGNYLKAVLERRDTTRVVVLEGIETELQTENARAIDLRGFSWVILLVLLFALAGQATFEPPQQLYIVGIILYLSALGMVILAVRRGDWKLSTLPADESRADSFSVRVVPFILSLFLGGATFFTMSENTFTATNVSLWAGTVIFNLWAFWVRSPAPLRLSSFNLREFFSRSEWTIRITRVGLAVVAIAAVSIFFHTYRLYEVAPEMTSDHAEKLSDVYDITRGMYSIYFPRNTGREPLYIYLCALFSQWFGLSFLTLKIVVVIGGLLTLPYIYLLGREMGGTRIGLLAAAFAGFGYWPTVIERFGLRISFYPLFAAATLYYFLRGLRRQRRNDFLLAGLALGLGLNGYTPFRIMPFVLVVLLIVYLLHLRDGGTRKRIFIWFLLLAFTSWILFIPLARFGLERPDLFGYRAFSRLGTLERPFPAPVWQIFLLNLWTALKEVNWYNGNIWVHSVPGRPALDVVSAALFLIGAALILVRYIRNRHWKDLMLLLAVPLLQMPSILSLAYPEENPSLNRTAGALVPVFLLVGFGLDSLLSSLSHRRELQVPSGAPSEGNSASPRSGLSLFSTIVLLGLMWMSFSQNFELIFNRYATGYEKTSWNSREMGLVIRDFLEKGGPAERAWIVPYPFWVDTRLPAFWAGVPGRDLAIAPENLESTTTLPRPKLFLFILQDEESRRVLESLYPNGTLTVYNAAIEHQRFYVLRVPAGP